MTDPSVPDSPSTFVCGLCAGSFLRVRPDAEVDAEAAELFPDTPDDDLAMVCDECFTKLMVRSGRWPRH